MTLIYDINRVCKNQKSCAPVLYNKIVTGGNNPSITRAMRYSQYVQNAKPKTVYVSGSAAAGLDSQGITFQSYFSPVLVSLQFTNLKQFNMPREKVFSRTNVQ